MEVTNELRNDANQCEIPALLSEKVHISKSTTSENESSDGENVARSFAKRAQRLSDSESDSNNGEESSHESEIKYVTPRISDSDDEITQNTHQRSRICKMSSGSEDDSSKLPDSGKVETFKSRTEAKSKKLKDKFKNLLNNNKSAVSESKNDNKSSSDSDEDMNSIERIKQKIQERNNYLKATLYDPDTSDDENIQSHEGISFPRKKVRKKTKLTSPKPIKMTAKQAMENMQKIKSESNRMLREKEVSLPYHRPKALSLKDIMSKCRTAVSSEGKALPIKMNGEQLKQYVKMLEERQKEVIQLCKSDTEEEDNNVDEDKNESLNVNNDSNMVSSSNLEPDNKNVEVASDKLFDDLDTVSCKLDLNAQILGSTELLNEIETGNNLSGRDETNNGETDPNRLEDQATDAELEDNAKMGTESDSQVLALHYTETDTERNSADNEAHNNAIFSKTCAKNYKVDETTSTDNNTITEAAKEIDCKYNDGFSDDDINMMDIDTLIENAEIIHEPKNNMCLPDASTKVNTLKAYPKLTGAPGLVIDLDNISDSFAPKSLSGVELLKERYIYFAKLKTPEEMEREKENRDKPGAQHLKLKHELEEKMAEQRSLEWAKRLAEEKAQQMEVDAVMGDQEDDDIEKLEAKLEEEDSVIEEEVSSENEELVEDDCDMTDKPKKRNPMVDDEAEVSDTENATLDENELDDGDVSEESSEESSESDDEKDDSKPKKGRILKAFEDSDDETIEPKLNEVIPEPNTNVEDLGEVPQENCNIPVKNSQDDELQLAQMQRSFSEDMFASQSSGKVTNSDKNEDSEKQCVDKTLGTQSFSIMENSKTDSNDLAVTDNFSMTCESQLPDEKLGPEVTEMLDKLPQNLIDSQLPTTQTQGFGDDVLALCTGNFFDSKFVSQTDVNTVNTNYTQESEKTEFANTNTSKSQQPHSSKQDNDVLKSILDELDSPNFDEPKANKYFDGNTQEIDNKDAQSSQLKKKFIIDSDDEDIENNEDKKAKKKKKKRMENRALQISDDEDELDDEREELESEIEEDDEEKIVEYDSEENEVVTQIPGKPKLKKKVTDFFEAEAELSSNEEWSGDEDERGLDEMEREDGDQDVFQQGRLRAELGAIHMREVLDQDKREVRMIQELLFEDGDLGAGHRQRRFRWKDINGEDVDYSTIPVFSQSQDDDFESVEQWRKQRYEREMFLRKMRQEADKEDISEIPLVDSIIKLNDTAVSTTVVNEIETEKKGAKDIPSPRKPLGVFQTSYRGSVLRGSSLGRLAALAAPLLDQESTTNLVSGNKRNFVFAAHEQPKVTKRKAPKNEGTPKLIKKLKTEHNRKNSLLEHLNNM